MSGIYAAAGRSRSENDTFRAGGVGRWPQSSVQDHHGDAGEGRAGREGEEKVSEGGGVVTESYAALLADQERIIAEKQGFCLWLYNHNARRRPHEYRVQHAENAGGPDYIPI